MAHISATRDNLTSTSVGIHHSDLIGTGAFREVYRGTYVGGNRNSQKAACKKFKLSYRY